MLNRITTTAMNTAAAIPAHCSSTASQSAPVTARRVHGSHGWASSNTVSRSQLPPRALSIEEPVTSMPITNSTSPIPRTAGITSGRFTSRVVMSRIEPKARAGSQSCSTEESVRSQIGVWDCDSPDAT